MYFLAALVIQFSRLLRYPEDGSLVCSSSNLNSVIYIHSPTDFLKKKKKKEKKQEKQLFRNIEKEGGGGEEDQL